MTYKYTIINNLIKTLKKIFIKRDNDKNQLSINLKTPQHKVRADWNSVFFYLNRPCTWSAK